MVKGKSTRRYNKLLIPRHNYYDIGGIINNLSGNPNENGTLTTGAFKGLTSAGSAVMSGLAPVVGQIGGKAISGGLESTAGNVFSGLSGVASTIPGPWGAVASAGLGVLGGITNRAFGSKFNEENIASIENSISRLNSLTSGASSLDELSNTMGATVGPISFSDSFVGSDGWFSSKAKKKARQLRASQELAARRGDLALLNNAENLQDDLMLGLQTNYAAFGGPLDFGSGAIEYDFMNKYLEAKELSASGQNKPLTSLPNSFAEGGGIHIKKANRGKFTEYCGGKVTSECIARGKRSSSPAVRKRATFAANARKWKHAFGGNLLTHGANFDSGVTVIGNGGTHEENPIEGVPMGVDAEGVPNLVEEGEVIFNDYVFSNRLNVPMAVRNKYKLRGNKPLTFADAAKIMSKESEERPNDPISKAGLEKSLTDLVAAQEEVREANSSRKFSKGGKLSRKYSGLEDTPQRLIKIDDPIIPYNPLDTSWIGSQTPTIDVNKSNWKKSIDNNDIDLAPTWMRYVPAFASGVMSFTDTLGLTNKPDYSDANMVLEATRGMGNYKPVEFNPIGNYLRYTPFDREFYINQMNAQAGATRRALLQSAGLNRGAGMAALLASDYNTQGQLGQLARQAEEYNLAQRQRVEEFNRGTDMFNTEGAMKADIANQEALMKLRNDYLKGTLSAAELRQRERQLSYASRSANLSNFINSLGDIGRENYTRNMILSDPSKYYYIDSNGKVVYKGSSRTASRGGYLTRKKKR